MSPERIAWAKAVAEESYDGQLIRDLCNALEESMEREINSEARDEALWSQAVEWHEGQKPENLLGKVCRRPDFRGTGY